MGGDGVSYISTGVGEGVMRWWMGEVLHRGLLQGWEPVGVETRIDNELAEDPSTQDLPTKPPSVTVQKLFKPLPTHCRYESPSQQAPDLAIHPNIRPVPLIIPPTLSPAYALTSLTPSLPILYCRSLNLIYQLQCTECNAFYSGETLETVWMDTGSSPQYRTQTYQLPSTHSPTFSRMLVCQGHTQTTRLHLQPHSPPIWNSIPIHPPITRHPRTQHPLTLPLDPRPSGT